MHTYKNAIFKKFPIKNYEALLPSNYDRQSPLGFLKNSNLIGFLKKLQRIEL